ncbi:MAG: hypothetical protein C0473_00360 [Cyanobacteria bacterium DS3.002]|nr:hypothetical protein [Cyanobacteria bacterium DS3.002]
MTTRLAPKSSKIAHTNYAIAISLVISLSGCAESAETKHGSDRTGHIVYALRDIKKGAEIKAEDVEDKLVERGSVPADAAANSEIVGIKSIEDIGIAQIISIRDFGKPLSKTMLEKLVITDVPDTKEELASVIVAAKDLKKGAPFTNADLLATKMPLALLPMDAIADSGATTGKKCKHGLVKGQLITQHDLSP